MSANSSRSAAARRMTLMSNAPRFALGQLVATPGAMELLEQTGFSAWHWYHAMCMAIGVTAVMKTKPPTKQQFGSACA
jgi:hypothetical protein